MKRRGLVDTKLYITVLFYGNEVKKIMVDNSSESFYSGASSSLDPDSENFSGYRMMNPAMMGTHTNPGVANQVAEAVNVIKQGTKVMEVGAVDVQTFETIPKQQFKEINALARLTGVRPTLHAPIVDPTGVSQQGWTEEQRASTERQFQDVIEKAHILDTKGNIPVVFHAANGLQGKTWTMKDGEKILASDVAIDRETGQAAPMKREYKFRPDAPEYLKNEVDGKWGKGTLSDVQNQLAAVNNSQWDDQLTKVMQFTKTADEVMGDNVKFFSDKMGWRHETKYKNGDPSKPVSQQWVNDEGNPVMFSQDDREYYEKHLKKADLFLKDAELGFISAFGKAFKYANSEDQKEDLYKISDKYTKATRGLSEIDEKTGVNNQPLSGTLARREALDVAFLELRDVTDEKRNEKTGKIIKGWGTPKLFETAEDFGRGKASETFSNVALHGYKKFGKDAPVVAIENWGPGTAFSTPEELGKLVDVTRDKFAEKLSKDQGIGKKQAGKIAERHIGVTWDVGHLNMFKQHGYTDKELAKMTKKIAPKVKHVHLTDNFGFADSHLVPGMGNVPFKEHMAALEKTGNLDEMHKIIESGGFIQQISKKGAHAESLAAFGSPIYGAKNQATWQSNMSGNYFAGYGMSNPGIHHGMYGSGFTTLPMELGGTQPGGGGDRFAGRGMA